jgi:ribonuclease R
VGIIRVARKGYGFVDTPEGEYFILRGYLRGAMDGDRVEVVRLRALEARRRQRMHAPSAQWPRFNSDGEAREMLGGVQRVLERAHETLIGTLHHVDGLGVIRPCNAHIPYDIFLDHRAVSGKPAEDGDVVVVRLTTYPTRIEAAQGYVEQVVGREVDKVLQIEIIIHEHDFETVFSAAALEEAAELEAAAALEAAAWREVITGGEVVVPEEGALAATLVVSGEAVEPRAFSSVLPRRDLRDRFIFTIDPWDAKDFDDALSVDFLDGQMRLGVHIADVSAYIAWDSALDLDARRRATSVYLPDRVIPMLPPPISDGLCSLRPGEDRLAFSVDMLLNSDGSVAHREFYPSLIRSSARLSYDEAQRILEGSEGLDNGQFSHNLTSLLRNRLLALHRLAKKLARRRLQRGAIEFEGVEAKILLDADDAPTDVRLRTKTDATSLVEEAMILANEQVAAHMSTCGVSMIYRCHEEPFLRALEELVPTLQEFGYARQGPPRSSREIQAILEDSADSPEHHLISSLLLRAMKRAKYTSEQSTHFGLASEAYTHFTSPIRRYPDLMVHRLLKSQLAATAPPTNFEKQLDWICEHSSNQEREAEQASREATALKLCEYLAPRIGECFSGIITLVNTMGFMVRENTTTAEGFVDREDLPDGLEYDSERHRYHDPATGSAYRLGQPVTVILKAADLTQARLHFTI